MKARVLDALTMHARGEIDTDDLVSRLESVHGAIDNAHAHERTAIWTGINGLIDHQYVYDESKRADEIERVCRELIAELSSS